MFQFSRRLLKRFRGVCRKAGLGRSLPPVVVESDGSGVVLRLAATDLAVELRTPASEPPGRAVLPFEVVVAAESSRDEPMAIEATECGAVATWTDRGVPQRRAFNVLKPPPFPTAPRSVAANSPTLLAALHEASATADDGSHRFALSRVELQDLGRVVGTDGRQLYLHDGFAFPWRENLLVARTAVFGSPEFADVPGVTIGRAEKHVVVAAGEWTVWLTIDADGRFPKTADVVPQSDRALGVITFDRGDAACLLDVLPRLPAGADGDRTGVVLSIGQSLSVSVSGKEETTEVRLPRSRREGVEVRLAVDREYLARTLRRGSETASNGGIASRNRSRYQASTTGACFSSDVSGRSASRILQPLNSINGGPLRSTSVSKYPTPPRAQASVKRALQTESICSASVQFWFSRRRGERTIKSATSSGDAGFTR